VIQVNALQTHDGSWHLQLYCQDREQVLRLWSFNKLIDLLDMASTLQLRITNEIPIDQYYKANDLDFAWDFVA
jgi:hypothetical protein